MSESPEHPDVPRLIVVFLRFYARMGQTGLARAARLAQSKVSALENGNTTLTEDALRRIAAATGVPWELVGQLRHSFNAILSAIDRGGTAVPRSAVNPEPLAISDYLLEDMAAPEESPSQARLAAEQIWKELAGLPSPRRRRAVQLPPRASRNWALAELLCHESERAASDSSQEALELAELALFVARRVEGKEEWRRRIQGYAWAFAGNARRVANDHSGAGEAFATAWELWRSGSDLETGLLQEWRMLSLEASLRRSERRFGKALDLLGRARQAAGSDPEAHAAILLKRGFVREVMGDLEGALATLSQAAPYVKETGDPRLLFALRFETAKCLCNLGRYEEAARLLPAVRDLAGLLGSQLDLVRVDWLTARLAARTGRIEEAIATQEEVRKSFADRGLPYDAALASLDLAVLYLEEGRTAEVQELAREMAEIFKAQGITREALAALTLFVEAAQKETATVELVRRVIQKVEGGRG